MNQIFLKNGKISSIGQKSKGLGDYISLSDYLENNLDFSWYFVR